MSGGGNDERLILRVEELEAALRLKPGGTTVIHAFVRRERPDVPETCDEKYDLVATRLNRGTIALSPPERVEREDQHR